nr:probable methyltransferase PMT24 [Aegilops tauschii subsp. strangulata]
MPLFDRDRYQRLPLDVGGGGARRPASSCATATIVLFVGLCLVAAWMMAPTSNVPMGVSPDKAGEDTDVGLTRSVVKGGDADITQATDKAAKEDHDGPAVQTTEVDQSAEKTDADASSTTAGKPDGDTVAGVESPSKNLTSSHDSGMTEGGDVAKPEEDRDKNVQNNTEEATTDKSAEDASTGTNQSSGNNADQNTEAATTDKGAEDASTGTNQSGGNNAEQNTEEATTDKSAEDPSTGTNQSNTEEAPRDTTDTGDQIDKSSDTTETGGQGEKNVEAAPTEKKGETEDNITNKNAEETPAYAKEAGDDGTEKNQTAFDDRTGDDAATGAASKNQTFVDKKDTPRNQTTTTVEDTLSEEDGMVLTNSSTANQGEERPVTEPVTGGDTETAELLPSGQAELLNETTTAEQDVTFPTQATESSEEKAQNSRKEHKNKGNVVVVVGESSTEEASYVWKLCNTSAGADYIPCLDNEAAIKGLKSNKHYEHRERHCPSPAPSCLVPLPEGYRQPIPWPESRERIWYNNVPHTKLALYKGHQNWVKVSDDGEHLVFPGGGTQFLNGASHYIDVIQEALPAVAWGTRSRVALDVGCGVASLGGYLFDKDVLAMSFAPKDEHEAQVQFALERGIPAISAAMGTKRLPFPGGAYDVVHCARCRVPWHIEGGKLLLEANRLLRPGGLFVWSATPVYRKDAENVGIWQAMAALTKSMCWEMVTRTSDTVDQTAMVIFKKPSSNECYSKRSRAEPPLCEESDDPNAAWNITLQACMHRVATEPAARGSRWPEQWPERLTAAPYWLNESQVGVYGKPAADDLAADTKHWREAVNSSYLSGMGIEWKNVRNVIDMRSVYGGLAAALRDMKVWVMNIVSVESPDTLPIIYERGLLGMYHDWCESLSTYPRSYDLVHADHLFSKLKYRCKVRLVMAEVDRILRPEGKMIVRDDRETAEEVERIAKSLHWEVRMAVSNQGERLLCFHKTMWRPTQVQPLG